MQDNEFDGWIKSALDDYRDHTPAEAGWQRFRAMQPPAPVANPLKSWLSLSVAANILLVVAVIWFMRPRNTADVTGLEAAHHTDLEGGNVLGPDPAEKETQELQAKSQLGPVVAGAVEPALAEAGGDAEDTPSGAASRHGDSPSDYVALLPVRKMGFEWQGIPGLPQPPSLSFAGTRKQQPPAGGDNEEKEKAALPFQTVVALQKQQMGNRIGWSAGMQAQAAVVRSGNAFRGYMGGAGLVADAALHPVFGVRSGLSVQRVWATTSRQQTISAVWQTSGGGLPIAGTNELNLAVLSVEVPLSVRVRLPVASGKSWIGQVGLSQSFVIGEHQTFYGLVGEEEEGDEEEEEDELHQRQVAEFRNVHSGTSGTSLLAEAGFRKKIGDSPWLWEAAVWYKRSLGPANGSLENSQLVGIRAGLFFSGWE